MHIAEVVTIAKSLPLLRLNTYKSLILSYSADYRRILMQNYAFGIAQANFRTTYLILSMKYYAVNSDIRFCEVYELRP